MQQARSSKTSQKMNTFIALQLREEFKETMESIQNLFLAYFPVHSDTLVAAKDAHLTLVAFSLTTALQTTLARKAFSAAWEKWLRTLPSSLNSIPLSCKGVALFDDSTLYLKLSAYEAEIRKLNRLLLQEFLKAGILCDENFTPHITLAKIRNCETPKFSDTIVDILEEVEVRATEVTQVSMLSMKSNGDQRYPCIQSLSFPTITHLEEDGSHEPNEADREKGPNQSQTPPKPNDEAPSL